MSKKKKVMSKKSKVKMEKRKRLANKLREKGIQTWYDFGEGKRRPYPMPILLELQKNHKQKLQEVELAQQSKG